MKITITTTIEISEENLPLIPVVINANGGKGAETDNEAIIRITETHAKMSTISLIAPSIPDYFGKAHADVAEAKLAQLENAISVTTTIDEN